MSTQRGTFYSSWARSPAAFGGRVRHNRERQDAAQIRRAEVVKLLHTFGTGKGSQRRIAAVLRVSEATISRDLTALFGQLPEPTTCNHCGSRLTRPRLQLIEGQADD